MGANTLKRKNRPLCETPRSGYFCGPDKYLRLQEHTISEELFPVMEVDSYFVLVRSGSGSFIRRRRSSGSRGYKCSYR